MRSVTCCWLASGMANLAPSGFSLEKTSGKIVHALQSDWSMKMAWQPFLCDFSNLCFAVV